MPHVADPFASAAAANYVAVVLALFVLVAVVAAAVATDPEQRHPHLQVPEAHPLVLEASEFSRNLQMKSAK